MAGKVTFRQAIADYDAKYSKGWSASYAAQKKNQERRMIAYFGDTDEQVKYLLWYVTHCEKDYSVFSLLAIPVLAGLRRGELCGLRWKDIDFEKKVIDVAQQRMQAGSKTVVKVPKMGDDNGKTRFERRQR